MNIHLIQRRAYRYRITHVNAQTVRGTVNLHVVFRYRQVKLAGLVENHSAQRIVGLLVVPGTMCHSVHIILQFHVADVYRGEEDGEEDECRQHQATSHHAPAGQRVHGS